MSPLEQIGHAVGCPLGAVYIDFSWMRYTLLEVETFCNRAQIEGVEKGNIQGQNEFIAGLFGLAA